MKELALLTGASSGIGLEMAKELAAKKIDLVLVARRGEILVDLKAELENKHGIKVYTFAKDLSDPANAMALFHDVKDLQLQVTMLINNAGFGGYGNFVETSLEEELSMIQVNISSLVALTKLFLPDMIQQNHGRIMNIASLLSFLPFPYYSVYSASKAFVLSFSETLRTELEGTNITVTALCPGPVDTAFNTSEMLQTNAYDANKPMDPQIVAKKGIEYMLAGKGTKIIGLMNWFIANMPRFSPRWLTLKITKHLASRKTS
ncbi:MAG TPA: SDR family oxidoreductase [Haliscomenobacter sp.]|uniref:SDR family NAD(P)-dependent oxidoreductase n=1 Tax=Haliscomenobacter sp. TaxID=2717303 RepID=UPI002C119A91|nr:SDR family oxidoreductase [Haliscomenobacter sp.]HOY19639.1 SDR family oxidoreductase [Haliscomenobacter sp.]HPH19375.1 SDR family oxidoreductase [Haliscomenobacter sp.]